MTGCGFSLIVVSSLVDCTVVGSSTSHPCEYPPKINFVQIKTVKIMKIMVKMLSAAFKAGVLSHSCGNLTPKKLNKNSPLCFIAEDFCLIFGYFNFEVHQ